MGKKIEYKGKQYDMDDLGELRSIQSVLVPDNWPTAKTECVRLYLSTQMMLCAQLRRHLAANWKKISKTAQEEKADGSSARVKLAFAFELDQSAPSVATIVSTQLGYSMRHSTKGKAQTHDLNQGDFFDDDLSVALDVKGFEKEQQEAAQQTTETPPSGEAAGTSEPPAENPLPAADPAAGGDVTAENTPGDVEPKKGKKSKKKK